VLAAALLLVGVLGNAPVKLDLYYEVLCGGCRDMILEQIYPVSQKLGDEVLQVNFFPYGNAQTIKHKNGSISFECQHGPQECYLNMVTACYLHHSSSTKQTMEFMRCMEKTHKAEQCSGAQWQTVNTCVEGEEGTKLMLEIAKATNALNPPHSYVPWPILDGKRCDTLLFDCTEDLLQVVCDEYTGTPVPEACKGLTRCYKTS